MSVNTDSSLWNCEPSGMSSIRVLNRIKNTNTNTNINTNININTNMNKTTNINTTTKGRDYMGGLTLVGGKIQFQLLGFGIRIFKIQIQIQI